MTANVMAAIDGTSCNTKDAKFPIPKWHVLCCPSCGVWKLRPRFVQGYLLWKCSGPESNADFPSNSIEGKGIFVVCGKWHSDESIKNFIGLQMVEE